MRSKCARCSSVSSPEGTSYPQQIGICADFCSVMEGRVSMYRYNGTLPARGNQGHFLRIISGASPLSDGYSANEAKESLLCDETCRFRSLEAVCPFFRKHLFHPIPPFPIPVPQTQND